MVFQGNIGGIGQPNEAGVVMAVYPNTRGGRR